jgi:hypothetical protein
VIEALYAKTDELLDGWTCDQSADCCHFERTGREPYLWPAEWAALEKAIARRGTRRGSLPVLDERRCPLLGRDGRCTVYEARPFGCRTFFCARGVGPTRRRPRDELARIGREIASLDAGSHPDFAGKPANGPDWPRPLSRLLAGRR